MHPTEAGRKLLNALLEGKDGEAINILKGKVDFTVENRGDNPLHLAARNGKLSVIKAMRGAGADLGQTNMHGNTAMHYAARGGYMELVEYLKSNNVDMNALNDDEGASPLDKAVTCQTMDVIEKLVDMGMNPNVVNKKSGDTPLHTALRSGSYQAMEGLLVKGANPDLTNNEGQRAADVAKKPSLRDSLKMYATLLIAMSSGLIKAKGMRIQKKNITKSMLIDRVGIVLEKFDIPKEFPAGLYCRREKAENASIELRRIEEETVFSDVFHIRVFDVNRDIPVHINLPLYKPPSEKEELVLRFVNSALEDRPVQVSVNDKQQWFCPLIAVFIPETTYMCAAYIRQKREENKISDAGAKITSEIAEDFSLDVPAGSFEGETILSLQVFDSNDDPDESDDDEGEETDADSPKPDATVEDEDKQKEGETAKSPSNEERAVSPKKPSAPCNPNLLTDVYQINLSGAQPKKGIMVQIPLCKGMGPDDEIAIVRADETTLADENALDVLKMKPKIVNSTLIFEVDHFCIYVATWKKKVATQEYRAELQTQIRSARAKRKRASLFAVVKKDVADEDGWRHVLVVECGMASKSLERRNSWKQQEFQEQNPQEQGDVMMAPGETCFVTLKGNATMEDEESANGQKIQFSACRPSFQAYRVKLNQGIYEQDKAFGHLIISRKSEANVLEEVAALRIRLTPPPRPSTPPPTTTQLLNNRLNKHVRPKPQSVQHSLKGLFKK